MNHYTRSISAILFFSYFLMTGGSAYAKGNEITGGTKYDTVSVTGFGYKPDSRINAVPAVQAALEACRSKENPVLVFPGGRYDFWPQHAVEKEYYESNTTDNNPKTLGIFIEQFKNLVIDGGGASFIFHGRMQPFTVDHSSGVTIKNVNIDWDIPLTAQGEVKDTGSNYIDVKIDEKQYPYQIENGKIVFTGEGWKSGIRAVMEYTYDTHLIAAQTGDSPCLGKDWQNYRAERTEEGIVRLNYQFKRKPAVKNILIFRHSARDHAGVFITGSKDIRIERLNLYHCAGLGILSQRSENLNFRNVQVVPNDNKGRYFSGHDDGMHFSACKGAIIIDSCRYAGLMDDPINIHGVYVKIIKKETENKMICRFMESMSVGMEWAAPGEEIAFIDHESLQTKGRGTVKSVKQLSRTDFEIAFAEKVPAGVRIGDGLENLSWTPAATISNSVFESCRARGILVTTPRKVVIQNNIFRSSGSAILIAGDVNSWYESGAVNDVLISKNVFESSCLTSNYQFSEAIISIFPEVPVMSAGIPPYHRDIRIVDNEFHSYDYPVLFAQSVSGLRFERNELIRSYDFKPWHSQKATFLLSGCRQVSIKSNVIGRDILGKNVALRFMDKKDVKLQKGLTIE